MKQPKPGIVIQDFTTVWGNVCIY